MVAHDNTVMNATITNATPSADDESTLPESTPIGTDPQRDVMSDVMSDVVPDVTPEEVPGTTIASTPATATVPAEEMKPSQSVTYRPMRWNHLDDRPGVRPHMGSVQRGRRHAGVHADIPALRAALPRTDHPRHHRRTRRPLHGRHTVARRRRTIGLPASQAGTRRDQRRTEPVDARRENPVRDRAMA